MFEAALERDELGEVHVGVVAEHAIETLELRTRHGRYAISPVRVLHCTD